ncbi:MAG: hypothetical protein RL748_2189 [Pseudomonadota bacterium]|jgi:uncharacterized protein (TIGR02001 family)
MKKTTGNFMVSRLLTLSLALVGTWAQAEEKKPDNEVSFNAALTTDYRYRGISQTRLKPALQGGMDYIHNPSGFYAGAWASTIKWVTDAGGDGNVEIDLYGGKKGEIAKDVSYDVGLLTYIYPSNSLKPSANTTEVYGQIGFGPAFVKYSYALTNVFGFADSKRSGYLDVGANIDLTGGYTLNLHAGHQSVRNNSAFSYSDYKVGITKDLGVASVAFALYRASTDVYVGRDAKNLGKTGAALSVSKTF